MKYVSLFIFILIILNLKVTGINVNDTIPTNPDTIRTKIITNYIIRSDTVRTDTVITYKIYQDTTLIDTSLNITNLLGSITKDTVVVKTKVTKPSPWAIGGNGLFHFSQGYLSYWVEGGESSIATLSGLSLFANYKKNKVSCDNFLQFKYGQLKTGENNFRKNDDKLELNTKFGHKAFKNFYYSFFAELKSQLFKGYDYPNDDTSIVVSNFMSPGYVVIAIGMDYKPSDNLSVLISPLTSKTTFVLDTSNVDPLKFGLEVEKLTKKEIGAYIKANYKLNITKNILLENKLDLFSNYLLNPQNIDIGWEIILVMKINKYISTNISCHLIYDDDIDIPVYLQDGSPKLNELGEQVTTKHLQFKEVLSVGFSYKF